MTSIQQGAPLQKAFRETVFPSKMSDDDRACFARALYAVHVRIFSGVSLENFISHVVEPPAELTAIQVIRDAAGDLAGYCAFHRYARTIEGRRTMVLRVEAGLLPEYRGQAIAHWFGMVAALREKWRHPFQRVIYLGTLVHPSSYRFFCKYFPKVFPRHGQEMSPRLLALAVALADSFEDPAIDPNTPLVRDVGWITKETLEHPAFVSRHGIEDVTHFKALNPGYVNGHGLVVLVPVTVLNVGSAILKLMSEKIAGWVRRRPVPL